MTKTEFKTKLNEIKSHIAEIENIKQLLVDTLMQNGYSAEARDLDANICEWMPMPISTQYTPLTVDEVITEYSDLIASTT